MNGATNTASGSTYAPWNATHPKAMAAPATERSPRDPRNLPSTHQAAAMPSAADPSVSAGSILRESGESEYA